MKKILIIGLLLFLTTTASATVNFLSVNQITKEYYWGDEDNSTGWIGWTTVPEVHLDTAEDDLKKLGYTETFFPYKIESYIFAALLVLGIGQYVIRRKVR